MPHEIPMSMDPGCNVFYSQDAALQGPARLTRIQFAGYNLRSAKILWDDGAVFTDDWRSAWLVPGQFYKLTLSNFENDHIPEGRSVTVHGAEHVNFCYLRPAYRYSASAKH